MIKFFELQGKDWLSGISYQDTLAMGGLFSTATSFDPFEKLGFLRGSLASSQLGSGTILIPITTMAHAFSGADSYVYMSGNRDSSNNALYRVQVSNNTIVDYSSQIHANLSSGTTQNVLGLYYSQLVVSGNLRQRLLYTQDSIGVIRSNTFTPASGSDTTILSTVGVGGTTPISFEQGADGYCYFTSNSPVGGAYTIGKIVDNTSTSGNTDTSFSLPAGYMGKGLCSDGYYLVIACDENTQNVSTAKAGCKVIFWDRTATTGSYIYNIDDSKLLGCRFVNGKVYVFGSKGLYVCNAGYPPKLVFPLTSTQLPANQYAIGSFGNFLYWVENTTANPKIYGYGHILPNASPILFAKYLVSQDSTSAKALAVAGDYFYTAQANTKVYQNGTGSTRDTVTILTSKQTLENPLVFNWGKVTLESDLATGQTLTLTITGGGDYSYTQTISYSTANAKRSFVFRNTQSTASQSLQDYQVLINVTGGASVARVALYGININDNEQRF